LRAIRPFYSILDLVSSESVVWIGVRVRSRSRRVIRTLGVVAGIVIRSLVGVKFVMFVGIGASEGLVGVVRGLTDGSEAGLTEVVDGLESGFIAELSDVTRHDDGAVKLDKGQEDDDDDVDDPNPLEDIETLLTI
jgi:hypothetical protein